MSAIMVHKDTYQPCDRRFQAVYLLRDMFFHPSFRTLGSLHQVVFQMHQSHR